MGLSEKIFDPKNERTNETTKVPYLFSYETFTNLRVYSLRVNKECKFCKGLVVQVANCKESVQVDFLVLQES